MVHNIKTYFVVKNTENGLFWNEDKQAWQTVEDRLDVLILSIGDDQDTQQDVENEYDAILNSMDDADKILCCLFKIHVETKIIF